MFDFKFDWSSSFETGIDSIDTQHKQLFKLGRDMEQLLRIQCIGVTDKQILDIVCGLRDFTAYHFYAEDSMMEEMKYKGIDAHRKYHAACSDYIMKLDLPKLKKDPVKELKLVYEEVKSWISFHVLSEDLAMAKAYNEYCAGLKTVVDKTADPLEQLYGRFLGQLDVTKVYLFKNQECKGHLVAVFDESATELVRLSTLERNMFFANISKIAKAVRNTFKPDAIEYMDLEDMNEKLVVHIIPKYKDEIGYGMLSPLHEEYDMTGDDIYQEIYDQLKGSF